jgi:hypothetical protein
MSEWWDTISAFEKIFWYFAIPFTIVFSIQLILTLIGIEWHNNDLDNVEEVDFNHEADFISGFRLFTLRNFIIFFLGFGWAGIFAVHAGFNQVISILVAFLVGLFLMFTVALMFFLMTKLTESGNITLSNSLNAFGRVYLPIPANRSGVGQVQITIQGSVREVEAVTDDEMLPTGTPVKVLEVINDEILVVKKSQ